MCDDLKSFQGCTRSRSLLLSIYDNKRFFFKRGISIQAVFLFEGLK